MLMLFGGFQNSTAPVVFTRINVWEFLRESQELRTCHSKLRIAHGQLHAIQYSSVRGMSPRRLIQLLAGVVLVLFGAIGYLVYRVGQQPPPRTVVTTVT